MSHSTQLSSRLCLAALLLFASHVAASAQDVTRAGRRGATRSITDRELEPFRQKREAQEAEYERTRQQRGMPSKRELQRRVEEQDERLREWARQMEAERLQTEVESLRAELSNVRRQLDVLGFSQSRQEETYAPAYTTLETYPYVYTPPFGFVGVFPHARRGLFARPGFGTHAHGRPFTFGARPGLSPFGGRVGRPGNVWAAPRVSR